MAISIAFQVKELFDHINFEDDKEVLILDNRIDQSAFVVAPRKSLEVLLDEVAARSAELFLQVDANSCEPSREPSSKNALVAWLED